MNGSSARSFLFLQSRIPAHDAVLPEFMVDPPISINLDTPLQTCLQTYPFKDLNPVRLTIKINHHILVNPHLCPLVGGRESSL